MEKIQNKLSTSLLSVHKSPNNLAKRLNKNFETYIQLPFQFPSTKASMFFLLILANSTLFTSFDLVKELCLILILFIVCVNFTIQFGPKIFYNLQSNRISSNILSLYYYHSIKKYFGKIKWGCSFGNK